MTVSDCCYAPGVGPFAHAGLCPACLEPCEFVEVYVNSLICLNTSPTHVTL